MPRREQKPYALLVEGNDDLHVISALMMHYQVPEVFDIWDCQGISPLLEAIPAHLLLRQRLGIVADADEQVDRRWREIRAILLDQGYEAIPNDPLVRGTIIRSPGKPMVGIWLMPNNTLPGKLEDFIKFLVPPADRLWQVALDAVDEVPDCPQRFRPIDSSKAQVHTWLAWQEEPGIPMGRAITRRFLDAQVAEVDTFVAWMRDLFL